MAVEERAVPQAMLSYGTEGGQKGAERARIQPWGWSMHSATGRGEGWGGRWKTTICKWPAWASALSRAILQPEHQLYYPNDGMLSSAETGCSLFTLLGGSVPRVTLHAVRPVHQGCRSSPPSPPLTCLSDILETQGNPQGGPPRHHPPQHTNPNPDTCKHQPSHVRIRDTHYRGSNRDESCCCIATGAQRLIQKQITARALGHA